MKFEPGMALELGGVHLRFSEGVKAPDDLRMDIFVPRWTPVSMKLGYVMADFYAQNEAVLYPRVTEPGKRYLLGCKGAQFMGWESPAEQLDFERAEARRRREAA